MTAVACIDQGTSSTRCIVVEDGGAWRLAASLPHREQYPSAGWVEQDPEELLGNVSEALKSAGSVEAVAIANQGESCLAWDAQTGEALSPVIVWKDARTTSYLADMPTDMQDRSQSLCGLPLDPYFSASKLSWLLRHVPAVEQARKAGRLRLGTTDAFFLDRLAGNFVTDVSTASRTGLLDLATCRWSSALCDLHGVPMECLPTIAYGADTFGNINGVPVKASIVDQQAALYGHGCRNPGECKITFGTGAFLLGIAGGVRPPESDLLPTIAWSNRSDGVTYAVEGGVYDAGASLDWARRVGLYSGPDELDDFEGPSSISRGLVFVPALSGLAAPYWDRSAAPVFVGMTYATDRRDMVRAVLEGIAMLTANLVAAAECTVPLKSTVSIDGGLSQSDYFAQFLASACNKTIVVPAMHELTALGLAELCGLDVSATRASRVCFAPDTSVPPEHHALFASAVARSRGWRVN